MECDVCAAEEVAFIVGNYQTGEQQFIGPGCFARMGLEFAKQVLPAEEVAAVLGPLFVTPAQPEAPKAESKRRPSKQAAKSPEPEAAPGPPGGTAEVPPTAENG